MQKIESENLIATIKYKLFDYFSLLNDHNSIKYLPHFDKDFKILSFIFAAKLSLTGIQKQELIEAISVYDRLKIFYNFLINNIEEINNNSNNKKLKISQEFQNLLNTYNQSKPKDNSIVTNTNAKSSKKNKVEDLKTLVEESKMHEEAKEICLNELNQSTNLQGDLNSQTSLNYVKTLISLPWEIYSEETNSIKRTTEILNRDHYGLDKIKDRIIEFLSVRKVLGVNSKGSILCFNGPPGVGKTSLAKSIAESLGRVFCRISLGGVRDESNIRGHRRTYIGSMPGNIIQTIKKANVSNPLILLDEIDKLGVDNFKGDVESALLEVLDPEQNSKFQDHYLGTYFDLSKVLFLCTSNNIEKVSAPLRDRMEIIDLSGYTLKEKLEITKKYLIPKQIKSTGLEKLIENFAERFSKEVIEFIIENYTFESGVRNLEQKIASVCRSIVKSICETKENNENTNLENYKITKDVVSEILGISREKINVIERTGIPGVAIVSINFTFNILFREWLIH